MWAQFLSRLLVDCLDLIVTLDERDGVDPLIAFRVKKDEDQEYPASEALESTLVVDGAGYGDKPTGERS
jgi:hypothetical protein